MIKLYAIKGTLVFEDGVCEDGILAYVGDRSFQISTDLNDPPKDKSVIGIVRPGKDGNYYDELIVFGSRGGTKGSMVYGLIEFLDDIVNKYIPEGTMVISEDFPFNPNELEVIELTENKG